MKMIPLKGKEFTAGKVRLRVLTSEHPDTFRMCLEVDGRASEISRDKGAIIHNREWFLAGPLVRGAFPNLVPFKIAAARENTRGEKDASNSDSDLDNTFRPHPYSTGKAAGRVDSDRTLKSTTASRGTDHKG